MEQKPNMLARNKTWSVVAKPQNLKPIICKWVFKRKKDQNGNVTRYKARLVARGYSQIQGLDFTETFAPVVRFTTLLAFLKFVAINNWSIKQFDVERAYLNAILSEEIYMEAPPGMDIDHNKCLRLPKSLYGLRQSAKAWYDLLQTILKQAGLKRNESEWGLFVGKDAIAVIYVDNCLCTGISEEAIENLYKILNKNFTVKNVGDPKWFLGIHIMRNWKAKCFELSQYHHIQHILKDLKMDDCKPTSIPLPTNSKTSIIFWNRNT